MSAQDLTLLDRPTDTAALAPMAQDAASLVATIASLAANPAVDVDKLQRLMEMHDRMVDRQARAAFAAAFATMQGELPVVVNRKKGDGGKWSYAPLEDIVEDVRPILLKHRFSLRHETVWLSDGKVVQVIGILTHEQGHEARSVFQSAADPSGSKNAIQGLGSAVAYGRRYTTKDVLGIVTADEDDNGASSQPAKAKAPAGFDNWAYDLEIVGKEQGIKALEEAWGKSKKEFKTHATTHCLSWWEKTKATARAVKP